MQIVYAHDKLLDEGQSSEFKGTVTIRSPLFHERALLPIKIGLADYAEKHPGKKADEEDESAKLKEGLKQLDIMARASEHIMQFVVECDLKNEAGEHLKTVEDLFSHPEASDLVMGLISKFVGGFVSKKKKP